MIPGDAEGDAYARSAEAIASRLEQVVLGQRPAIRETLAALLARGQSSSRSAGTRRHCWSELLRSCSTRSPQDSVHYGSDAADITGVRCSAVTASSRSGRPMFGDLVLADEINRAPAKKQAALLEAMQEGASP